MHLSPCIPCQYGAHEEHVDVPGPVPEGVIGGWVCPCKGECIENQVSVVPVVMTPRDIEEERKWEEAFEFLEQAARYSK